MINSSLADLLHFLVGWTLLKAGPERIGASRTSPLTATNPLFAALILSESPSLWAWLGMLLTIGGVSFTSNGSDNRGVVRKWHQR